MKLARFSRNGSTYLGKVVDDRIVDLSAVAPDCGDSMRLFLEQFDALRPAAEAASEPSYALDEVTLEAPVGDPRKFLAIGMNYQSHADEAAAAGVVMPKTQIWFNKQVTSINGPYANVDVPKEAPDMVDYEAEMGVVIGKRCRHVKREDVRSVIAGYLVCNDVTARDWQFRSPTYTLGKSFDTHGPHGPWLVLADEVADPHALEIRMFVNGEQRQKGSTANLIHNIFEQISYLSTVMTLKPGDMLATGTPAGVGAALDPPQFLQPGDVMRVEIEGIGHIENRVVAE